MYDIFRCCVGLLTIYICSVIGIMMIKQCSVVEARTMFFSFLKGAFAFSKKPIIYPVIVGYDEGRIIPDTVNKEFSKIRDNFAVCYFRYHQFSKNNECILYVFDIQRKKDSLPDEELEILLQKQAEEVVTKTMQSNNCVMSAEPLTFITLKHDKLGVHYALTESGVNELDKLKQIARNRRITEKKQSNTNEFVEDWDNDN